MKLLQHPSNTYIFAIGVFCFILLNITITINTFALTQRTPTYSCSIPISRLDWNTRENSRINPCILPKFDTYRGSLTQVTLTLSQLSQGEYGIENTSSQPANLSSAVTTRVRFYNGSELLQELITNQNDNLNAANYDTAIDYQGNSGFTIPYQPQTQSQTFNYTDAATLQSYSNSIPGLVETISIDAEGTSSISVNEGIFSQYDSFLALDARATAEVFYTYQHNTPDDDQTLHNNSDDNADQLLRSGGTLPVSTATMIMLGLLAVAGIKFSLLDI